MKKYTNHLRHYLPLIGVLGMGFLGFTLFSYDKNFQFIIAASAAISYLVWGVIHHHIHRDLNLTVFLEYLLVSLLGLIVVYTLVFN